MLIKILLLDIETAPNIVFSWGLWQQNIGINQIVDAGYALCWAAKWLGSDKIEFASVFHNTKKNMLKKIHKMLDDADVVVHYNGKRFDIPTLNKEFIKVGLLPPSPYKQVDLLSVARRQFKFASNKLDYVARFLGLGEKVKHRGMDLWRDCMERVPEAWEEMRGYNIQDVILLEKVYNVLLPWIGSTNPNRNVFEGTRLSCPSCGSHNVQRRGTSRSKTLIYQRFACTDCGSWSRSNKAEPRDNKQPLYVPL